MKFLADEDMSRPLTRAAEAVGHEIVWLPKGTPDTAVFAYSKKEKLPILTFDTDFLDTAKFPLTHTPGRIVLRIFPTVFSFQREKFEAFLTGVLPDIDISDRLVELFADRVEVRKE